MIQDFYNCEENVEFYIVVLRLNSAHVLMLQPLPVTVVKVACEITVMISCRVIFRK